MAAKLLSDRHQYRPLMHSLQMRSPEERVSLFRALCQTDLYFLLRFALGRIDIERDWLFDRCREVQRAPDDHLDLWAREHYKSSIITFGLTIQEILNDPEITIGIFSHTRPIAKTFLRQIKQEFETNIRLRDLFPEIMWRAPSNQAPKWSEDDGIVVRRRGNPKEATVEAWGVVDGQPTAKHFKLLIYDDVVTDKSVTTPEMIAKTTDALSLSFNLGELNGRRRFCGTRYHYNDSYTELTRRGVAKVRLHPATADGTADGEPVLLTREQLAAKRRDQGPYIFSCQMLQNPVADEVQGFRESWLRYYTGHNEGRGMNIAIVVDAASAKKKSSDYTAMWAIGLGADMNYYALDIVRDRLSLTERANALFDLHRRWRPTKVGYEKYGMMADIEHIKERQARENYRFDIVELGGKMPKPDRIKRMIPICESGRLYLPERLVKTDYERVPRDLVQAFVEEEYKPFPVGVHDDMMDALSRVLDDEMAMDFPLRQKPKPQHRAFAGAGGWMA